MNNRLRKLTILALVMILAIALVSCNKKDKVEENLVVDDVENIDEIKVEDNFGRVFISEKPAEKVVSLSPSNTEILFALGLDDEIIGVTTSCNYPEKALEKEKIGGYSDVNLEKIIELNPDLVVVSGEGDPDIINRLAESDIQVLGYDPKNIDEIIDSIISIGQATGKNEEAKEITEEIIMGKDEVLSKIEGIEPVKTIYEIWHDPITVAGSGSFIDSLIKLANGINIADQAEGEYPIFDVETLIEEDPQVYLLSTDAADDVIEGIGSRPGFSEIDAIKNDRVYVIDADTTMRPGPRIIEALQMIAEALHPEIIQK